MNYLEQLEQVSSRDGEGFTYYREKVKTDSDNPPKIEVTNDTGK